MTVSGSGYASGGRIGDRYVVLEDLGRGSDGHVYLVTDTYLAINVAIKLLEPRPGQKATWDEAQLLEQLKSDFLLPVYNADVLPALDIRYITTAYMPGGDLQRKASPYGVTTHQAQRWGVQISHGLERIHTERMVHRDIKPGNVFISENGDALLGDLGKVCSLDKSGTAPPDGTPATVAPEVLMNDGRCTVQSDIYSLGATIFFLLTGRFPVNTAGSTQSVLKRVRTGEKRRLRNLAPHVSQGLSQVIEKCLSLDPSKRPSRALDVANQLAAARCHSREWGLVPGHGEHVLCMAGGPKRGAKPVIVCAVPVGPGTCDIQVRRDGGSRARRFEVAGIPQGQVATELRRIAKDL